MAETLIENQNCNACGVEVRPNSMFCYNCGGSVTDETPAISENGLKNTPDKIQSIETGAQTSKLETLSAASDTEKTNKAASPVREIAEKPKLKSAAAMRRQTKSFQKKNVEVVWEQPEKDSLLRLFLVALVLMIFVAAIIFFGVYSK